MRTDPRVAVMERTNLRNLRRADLPGGGGAAVDIVTLDLSFISATKMIDTVWGRVCGVRGWREEEGVCVGGEDGRTVKCLLLGLTFQMPHSALTPGGALSCVRAGVRRAAARRRRAGAAHQAAV